MQLIHFFSKHFLFYARGDDPLMSSEQQRVIIKLEHPGWKAVKKERLDCPELPVAMAAPSMKLSAELSTSEELQCSRCLKWLQRGAKFRNKRLKYVN